MKIIATLVAVSALAGCTIIPAADPPRGVSEPSYPQPTVGEAPLPPSDSTVRNDAPQGEAPLFYAALGQSVTVGGPRITPLAVLEDSRCPMNARCVWAGQVRLRVRQDSGRGGVLELTSGKPAHIADGTLELVDIRPDKMAGASNQGAIDPTRYRFGFRFTGGY
ncbi:hypothetical protein ASE49_13860 [Novosphingobium sp. Leaf2]|nr:hypothetical protein ASE49_13860 [Novosphingobium sp. Leaf2]